MSTARAETAATESPHPRATNILYGHDAAEQTLLGAYRSGRMPHAWLISGCAGISNVINPNDLPMRFSAETSSAA